VNLPNHSVLTPREEQVLDRLLRGASTREIADTFGLSRQTVKNYVTVIYDKLGVRGRSQLFRQASAIRVPQVPTPAPARERA